jgi:hypothetical protein
MRGPRTLPWNSLRFFIKKSTDLPYEICTQLIRAFHKYHSDAETDSAIHGYAASHCIPKKFSRSARSGIRHFAADLPYFEERVRGQNWVLIYLIAEGVPSECPRAREDAEILTACEAEGGKG